jgi:hypothetical protein
MTHLRRSELISFLAFEPLTSARDTNQSIHGLTAVAIECRATLLE